MKDLNDKKNLEKQSKRFISDKSLSSSNTGLKEKGNLITDNQKSTHLFNTCFINTTNTLQSKNHP